MATDQQFREDRLVIFTGPRHSTDSNVSASSISRLAKFTGGLLTDLHGLARVKEIIVAGGWTFSKDAMEVLEAKFGKHDLEDAVDTDLDEPLRTGDLSRARSQSSVAQKNTLQKHELEWSLAISFIKSILEKIQVDCVRWETDLPFSKELWSVIPDTVQKLTLNMFVPDGEDRDINEPHPDYFTHDDLMHLTTFENLRSLRIYNMADSFQSIIWETVWKNPGLATLELGMRDHPITRDSDNDGKPMPNIDAEWNYDTNRAAADNYRGREGAGMLDHRYGHGEYLDHVAISKARNAVRYSLGDLNALPMTSVYLSNFVVDDTSFSKYFDGIGKIVFCKGCVDAGFILPKNLNDKVQLFTCGKEIGEVDAQDMLEVEVKTASEEAA